MLIEAKVGVFHYRVSVGRIAAWISLVCFEPH